MDLLAHLDAERRARRRRDGAPAGLVVDVRHGVGSTSSSRSTPSEIGWRITMQLGPAGAKVLAVPLHRAEQDVPAQVGDVLDRRVAGGALVDDAEAARRRGRQGSVSNFSGT